MTNLAAPAPLVPAEVDLRDFAFMPLDVVRLRDSDLAALESPEACWAAVLLWCASWHQVPAASVPDDDRVLANLAGFGRVVKEWQRVREGALRGWVACSDGRLYHPVVAEKAREAWRSKLFQRWKTEAGRVKKHNQRHELTGADAVQMPEFDAWIEAGCPQGHALPVPGDKRDLSPGTTDARPQTVPGETGSKGQGYGQGQGQGQLLDAYASSSAARTGRPTIPCPYVEIVGLYHELLPTLPQVRVLDGKTGDARKRAMREMWGWVLSSTKPDGSRRASTADEAIEWFRAYFTRASENDFVMGRTARGAGHEHWRADLDYLLSRKGLTQVIEKTAA